MSENSDNCLDLPISTPVASPYSRFVLMDVGPEVWGAAECAESSLAFRFDTNYYGKPRDEAGVTRYTYVYSFRRLPPGAFEQMASLVSITRREPIQQRGVAGWLRRTLPVDHSWESRWPVWIVDWDQPDHIRKNLLESLQRMLDTAGPPEMVLATNDPTKEILAARQVTPEQVSEIKDWFAFLGLSELQ